VDAVEEAIFENGPGLRISSDARPVAPEPVAAPELPAGAWAEETIYRVVLNLSSGESAEVATFGDEASADSHARDIAGRLAATSEWPHVRGRYLRPETIVSIEVSARKRVGTV
jgi:hypothetical protein